MKKTLLYLLLSFTVTFNLTAQIKEEPDYTKIKFRKKVKDYKKKKPKLANTKTTKKTVEIIVNSLADTFYTEEERKEIIDKIWLAFIDPKKFDMVYRDYAIRTQLDWNKPNFKGDIVIEPNPYLKDWTKSDTEYDYFKIAMNRILMYEGLMGYAEDAKKTKKALENIRYIEKYKLPNPSKVDWTNSYLEKLSSVITNKGLAVYVTDGGFEFFICKKENEEKLVAQFAKLRWDLLKL